MVPINYEIISWIMGFGSAAVVIEPKSLRKQIMEEHVRAAKQYKWGFSEKKHHSKSVRCGRIIYGL